MNPRHGEVWLVDMGMVAKTRPAIVLMADNLNAPRSLIIHVPITKQNRGSEAAASVASGTLAESDGAEKSKLRRSDMGSFQEYRVPTFINAARLRAGRPQIPRRDAVLTRQLVADDPHLREPDDAIHSVVAVAAGLIPDRMGLPGHLANLLTQQKVKK